MTGEILTDRWNPVTQKTKLNKVKKLKINKTSLPSKFKIIRDTSFAPTQNIISLLNK